MSFSTCLYQLFIGPLELLFEAIYTISRMLFQNSGIAIVFLSLAVNVLVLPLYKRADAIQAEERALEKSMEHWVSHIKRTFSGDERFMMLQSYYRQNNYKPYYSLKATLPLLLQIPFFIAAYRFLSNLEELRGMSFGPIADLGAPDAMLVLAGLSINVLPVLMTVINIIASAIYAKGFSFKEKVQLYGMALVFLVLLYNSPAGLVFYWTLNNVFSLGKNIVQKLKACQGAANAAPSAIQDKKAGHGLYALGSLFLILLSGLLIPSAIISISPAEFIVASDFHSPLYLVLNALLMAAGCFGIWFGIFYYLADDKGKKIFALLMWLLSGLSIANYMFFGTKLGMINPELKYDVPPIFYAKQQLFNLAALAVLALLLYIVWSRRHKLVRFAYVVLCLAVFGMSAMNVASIQAEVPEIRSTVENLNQEKASFTLSKNGQNVVLVMMDRAISSYIPYIFKESPEIAEQFEGFTYYPNTLSHGNSTRFAAPAVFGGYEYTPEEMNRRDDITMVEKNDESLKLMPVLFGEAGYDVTVIDPPYAGYSHIPDLSIYNEYPYVDAYVTTTGQFDIFDSMDSSRILSDWCRNFFCYSLMKMSPLSVQNHIYQNGTYLDPDKLFSANGQVKTGMQQLEESVNFAGLNFTFAYSYMYELSRTTKISNEKQNNFVMMANNLTHEPHVMQMPGYNPYAAAGDDEFYKAYYKELEDLYTIDGKKLLMDTDTQIGHYHSNYTAIMLLGRWFDYLRENDVYDNTRIIIVSDHGYSVEQFEGTTFGEVVLADGDYYDTMHFNPLLMVKDFDSKDYSVDESFMTNADVPAIALDELIENPVNPFTGNPVDTSAKATAVQHVIISNDWQATKDGSTRFLPDEWYAVQGDVLDPKNWKELGIY